MRPTCTTTPTRPKASRRLNTWRARSWRPGSTCCSSVITIPPRTMCRCRQIADARGVPFIPSLELSPSWGHFNAWPLRPGQKLEIDTATATIDEVLCRSPPPGRDRRAVESPVHSLWLSRKPRCRPRAGRLQSRVRPRGNQLGRALRHGRARGDLAALERGASLLPVGRHGRARRLEPRVGTHPDVRLRRGPAHAGVLCRGREEWSRVRELRPVD